jgi:toxin ParE1/3/4
MKKFEVSFRPLAEADLFGLYRFIAEEAGHGVAGADIDRIEAACMALETFPERGTRRDDIRPGLRTMGFERRATIVFQVKKAGGDCSDLLRRAGLGARDAAWDGRMKTYSDPEFPRIPEQALRVVGKRLVIDIEAA